MIITVVHFKAYDKPCTEAFVDKEIWHIHKILANICNTYVPVSIKNITDEKDGYKDYPVDVNLLVNLQEEAAKQVSPKIKS